MRQVHLSSLEKIPRKNLVPLGPLFLTKTEKIGLYQLIFKDVAKFLGVGPREDVLERMVNEILEEAKVSAKRIGATHILNVKLHQDVTRFKFSRDFLVTFEGMMHGELKTREVNA